MGQRSNISSNRGNLLSAGNAETHPYDLSHPVIRPACRRLLEQMHRALAQRWTSMVDDGCDAAIQFADLATARLSDFASCVPGGARVVNFTFARTGNPGLVVFYPEFVSALVRGRMGESDATSEGARQFSRLESAIARDLEKDFVAELGDFYRSSEVGGVNGIVRCATIADNLMVSPADRIIAFRFITAGFSQPAITILAGAGIIDEIDRSSVHQIEPVPTADTHLYEPLSLGGAGTLPVNIDLVMGGWNASIRELAALRKGDSVVLPDGENAWIQSGAIRIKRVRMKFTLAKIALEPLEADHGAR